MTTPQITTTPNTRRSIILIAPVTSQALTLVGSTRSHAAAPRARSDWLWLSWLDDPVGLLGLGSLVKHRFKRTDRVSVPAFFGL